MSLEEAIVAIDNSINDTYVDIKKTEKSLEEKNTRIAEYQSMSSDLALRIKKNRETIL
jgi:peptidoglycan hydrolase CwlO-like protein